ncbi:hypothetical protein [Clostridium paraputrificum]|uniref:hypothetical protein n=1 Tax=Clostridium paraputrificum TaxID=29363 RepID=UPI0015D499BE|nr:hypothetical protein [Clostridium paraputrificum]
MGKVINLNTKESRETKDFKEFISLREYFIAYGRYLEKNNLEDTIINYEKFLAI